MVWGALLPQFWAGAAKELLHQVLYYAQNRLTVAEREPLSALLPACQECPGLKCPEFSPCRECPLIPRCPELKCADINFEGLLLPFLTGTLILVLFLGTACGFAGYCCGRNGFARSRESFSGVPAHSEGRRRGGGVLVGGDSG